MRDTITDPYDENDPHAADGVERALEGLVPVTVEIYVTINPGSGHQQRLHLRAEDLEEVMELRTFGLTWTQALLAVAVGNAR